MTAGLLQQAIEDARIVRATALANAKKTLNAAFQNEISVIFRLEAYTGYLDIMEKRCLVSPDSEYLELNPGDIIEYECSLGKGDARVMDITRDSYHPNSNISSVTIHLEQLS